MGIFWSFIFFLFLGQTGNLRSCFCQELTNRTRPKELVQYIADNEFIANELHNLLALILLNFNRIQGQCLQADLFV